MKKHFFYAAMALAVMSSCSKDNESGIGNPEESNDRVPIELGLNTPTVSAISRGTGSVGDVEGDKNTWNKQRLFIYMVDRETGLEAQEGADGAKTTILDNATLEFRAPKAGDANNMIRIYNTYDAGADQGTIQYKYYPTNGRYTFYGYHIDDATADTPTITATEKKVTGITIDGTQDLLAAKTIEMTAEDVTTIGNPYYNIAQPIGATDWATLMGYSFGARTARKKVVPILKFDHQLARLKFFVRAGSDSSAGQKYEGNAWVANNATDGTTLGMQVTGITLTNMADKVDMDLATATSQRNGTTFANFAVCTKAANGTLDSKGLETTPVVPKYPFGDANIPENDADKNGTQVGEPIMFYPNGEIALTIDLQQYVKDTENEATNEIIYKVLKKSGNKLTIKESSITGTGATQKFQAGASYNVYITIYGFEDIRISAVLTAWTEGGDINADLEDGTSKP